MRRLRHPVLLKLTILAVLILLLIGLPQSPFLIIRAIKNKPKTTELLIPVNKLSETLSVNGCSEDILSKLYDKAETLNLAKSGLNIFRARLNKEFKTDSNLNSLNSKLLSSSQSVNNPSNTCLVPLKISVNSEIGADIPDANLLSVSLGYQSVFCSKNRAYLSDDSRFFLIDTALANYATQIKEKKVLNTLNKKLEILKKSKSSLAKSKDTQKGKIDREIRKVALAIAYAQYFLKDSSVLAKFFNTLCSRASISLTPNSRPATPAITPIATASPIIPTPTPARTLTPANSRTATSTPIKTSTINPTVSVTATRTPTITATFSVTNRPDFKIDDLIRISSASTKIRSAPYIADDTLIGTQSTGATGIIIGGPVQTNDDYGQITWWNVEFDSGVNGWCGENNYELLPPCTNGQTKSRTMYLNSEVPEGQSCLSEQQTKTCVNGKYSAWTGSYKYSSCYQPPTTENLCKTGLANSISQYGVTWTFDRAYPCGLFANGDYWVSPVAGYNNNQVKILSISPDFNGYDNGWEVNPDPMDMKPFTNTNGSVSNKHIQAYTNRVWSNAAGSGTGYDGSLMPALPYNASPGSSIVKAVGNSPTPECERTDWLGNKYYGYRSLEGASCEDAVYINTAAVLTVVNSPVLTGTFRPPYSKAWKPFYNYSNVDLNRLKKLPIPSGATLTNLEKLERRIQRLQLDDGGTGWTYTQTMPLKNFPIIYGADITAGYAEIILRLQLNESDAVKEPLLKKMIQIGIDYYGQLKANKTWPADGGHFTRAKLPILFAGYMLNDQDMLQIMNNYGFGTFQEDVNWFYAANNTVYPGYPTDKALKCYSTLESEYNISGNGFARFASRGKTHPDPDFYGENVSCISSDGRTYWQPNLGSQRGNAIAIEILGLQSIWKNPPFFEHMHWTWKKGLPAVHSIAFNEAMYGAYHCANSPYC